MTPNAQFTPPEPLASAIGSFAKGYGLNTTAATLVLLQAAGAVAAGTIHIVSPEMLICTPAIDIAMIHDGHAMLHGGLLASLYGVRQEIEASMLAQESGDRRALIEHKVKLQARSAEVTAKIRSAEQQLEELQGPPVESTYPRRPRDYLNQEPAVVQIADLEQMLPKLTDEQAEIRQQLADVMLALYPGVIRDNGDWREFADAGRHSFDGHFIQIAEAASLLGETTSTSNRLRECAALLHRSRSDSPMSGLQAADNDYRACLHLSGSADEFARLLRHPRIQSSGLLNSAIFFESDGDQPYDADALVAFANHEWHGFIAGLLRLRAAGMRTEFSLDNDGLNSYLAFRTWSHAFSRQLPVEQRHYFLRWPETMMRIATTLALIDGVTEDGVLEAHYLESAGALLREVAEPQAGILGRLLDQPASRPARMQEQVGKLVRCLQTKGPQTRRDLVRSVHGQSYTVIDARIFAAVSQGAVVQKGDRFYAANVSVNASTEPTATENEGGVAA